MTGRRKLAILISIIVAAAGSATLLFVFYVYRQQPITLRGVVLARNSDVDKQVPIPATAITAANGAAVGETWSGSTGFFELTLQKSIQPGQPVTLEFRHAQYEPLDLDVFAGDRLYVVRMIPISQPQPEYSSVPAVVVSNLSVRYTVKTTTELNVGSVAKAFRVVNTGNIPCNGRWPCSPNGKWKATIGTATLKADEGNYFLNARVTCIAGPCAFTKIKSDGFSRGGPTLRAAILNWSDTTTFLFEAEVFHSLESESVRRSYPVIFGRTLNFTVPAAAEGVCIEADIDSDPIVFPLGPALRLKWASCEAHVNPDRNKAYRCDLKPGYQFK